MAQENNKAYQKNTNNSSGTNKNNNYNKYKKSSSGGPKNTNYNPNYKKPGQSTGTKKAEDNKNSKNENYKSNKNYYKNKNYKKKNFNPRRNKYTRNPAIETLEDIKRDIRRIEKEIRLEIEEIKSLKV